MFGSFWRFFDGGMSVERLTEKDCKTGWPVVRPDCTVYSMTNRLAAIEDILGDDYDLDRLRALVQADKEGRCVVLPDRKQTSDDGENALKSAMNTLYYHNNPVTRYIADAVAEKLTREAAAEALRRKQNE